MEFHVGGSIHRLHNLLCRDTNRFPHGDMVDSLTGSHGFVLCWLHKNSGRELFQRDLEKQFQLRRSSATAVLQTLERNGLIRRSAVEADARLKKLVVTEKGAELCRVIHDDIADHERRLTEGLSAEELRLLQSVFEKLHANLERGLYSPEELAESSKDTTQRKEGNETT